MGLEKLTAQFNTFLDTKLVPLKQKPKMAIWIGTLLLPLVAFYFLVFSPNSDKIKGLEKDLKKLRQEITELEKSAAEITEHRAEIALTEAKFRAASLLLPQQKEIPSLLTNISSQGANSGLEFLTFMPGGEAAKDFYAEIPLDISVRGPYHNVGTFLYKLSKLPRIVSVTSLTMGSPVSEGDEMILNTTCKLVTFRFIEGTASNEGTAKTEKK